MANNPVKNHIRILAFGIAAEKMKCPGISVENIPNSTLLKTWLEEHYPELKGLKLSIAVNKKIIHSETLLPDGAEVALLPPFSGG
ncbi:MAG: MoaD/ThiS family protein [Chitinophagaceae bacterium]|nr:MoaD/ThiS family protein [Chitinophagaceae bacterium]